MTDDNCERLALPDGEVVLYRDTKWMEGKKEIATGDHMIVRYITGSEDDVVVLNETGELKVKRLVTHFVINMSPSTVGPPAATYPQSFADLPEEVERRLLAIYKLFPNR